MGDGRGARSGRSRAGKVLRKMGGDGGVDADEILFIISFGPALVRSQSSLTFSVMIPVQAAMTSPTIPLCSLGSLLKMFNNTEVISFASVLR